MITIFTTPKSFKGHIGIIQHNAIKSWTMLVPKPEIILFGNDSGTEEICHELGLLHVSYVETSKYGTPLVNYLFEKAQELAKTNLLCYVNADIILMSDFIKMIEKLQELKKTTVAISRRWDLDITEPINFNITTWEEDLRNKTYENGKLRIDGIDYFIFPKGLYKNILPFAIGREYWDDWLCYEARKSGAMLLNTTNITMAIHQNHPSSSQNIEVKNNWELSGTWHYFFRRSIPTHEFKEGKICQSSPINYFIHMYCRIVPYLLKRTYLLRRCLGLYRWWKKQER